MQEDSSQHPVEYLADLLAEFGDYPDGVMPVPACITGVAFFPGGSGLWGAKMGQRLPPMPVGKVMALGHNFDSVAGYEISRVRGYERENSPTWGPLLKLLCTCDIAPEDCFFTNTYMGLKADIHTSTGKNISTGPFPGAENHSFVYRCRAFLLKQIRAQQPRLMLTLGEKVLPVLTPLAPGLTATWLGARHLADLDGSAAALVYPVQFPGVPHSTAVVALTHPANRGPNVKRRSYNGQVGDAAECALVRDGLVACGLASQTHA
ncbi:MAG TPA: hypothetical protein VIC27_02035 [Ktedonobacterales bacterium]